MNKGCTFGFNKSRTFLDVCSSFILSSVLRQVHSLCQSDISVRIKWSGWILNFSRDYDALRSTKTAFFMVISKQPQISQFGHSRYNTQETFKRPVQIPRHCKTSKKLSELQRHRQFLRIPCSLLDAGCTSV